MTKDEIKTVLDAIKAFDAPLNDENIDALDSKLDSAITILNEALTEPKQSSNDLSNRLRDTASKGVSVWGDLQMEAAKEIETLLENCDALRTRIQDIVNIFAKEIDTLRAERDCYASAMDRMKAALAEPSEPVAWRFEQGTEIFFLLSKDEVTLDDKKNLTPLFTHSASKPAPLPELTDEEVGDVARGMNIDVTLDNEDTILEFARAILAAAREKAK